MLVKSNNNPPAPAATVPALTARGCRDNHCAPARVDFSALYSGGPNLKPILTAVMIPEMTAKGTLFVLDFGLRRCFLRIIFVEILINLLLQIFVDRQLLDHPDEFIDFSGQVQNITINYSKLGLYIKF